MKIKRILSTFLITLLSLLTLAQPLLASNWIPVSSEIEITSIQGKTLVFNQKWNPSFLPTQTKTGITLTNNGDGSYTINGTSDTLTFFYATSYKSQISIPAGHIVYYGTDNLNIKTIIYINTSGGNVPSQVSSSFVGLPTNDIGVNGDITGVRLNIEAGTYNNVVIHPILIDLTIVYGVGSEPTSVEQFKADFPADYYEYNTGTLINTKVTNAQTDVDTIDIPVATYSLDGMKSAGTVYDELTKNRYIKRIGSRAYQTGDENNTNVITDKTNTYYVLTEPIETPINPPLDLTLQYNNSPNITFLPMNTNTTPLTTYPNITTTINSNAGQYTATAGSGALFEDLLNDVPQDANLATLNLSSNITTLNTSFAVPNNVTINLNGKTITGVPQQYKDFVEWINRDTQTPATSFVSGNTYDAVYTPQSRNITYMIPSMTNISVPTMDDYELTLSGNNYTATDTYPIGEGKLLPIPKMTGCTFDGWYTNANYTGQRYTSVPNNATTNLTYYAKWRTALSLIEIKDVHVYRNLMNVNDRLITFMYNIDWGNHAPTSSLNDWFTFNLLDQDGTTILATCQPYPFWDYGYGHGVGSFYFGNDDLIDWGGEYQIRIDGDSSKWTDTSAIVTIYNLQAINYSDTAGNEANKDLLTGQIINYARTMEIVSIDENFPMLVYVDANGNTILTTQGQVYFRNDIPNIAKMTNGIFSIGSEPVIIDPSDTPTPSSQTLIDKWETQYEGTWVQDSLEGLGDLLGMNWRTATSILLLVAWVVLASISQIRWGTTDAGMWCGGVLMGVGVTMGIMNWAIVGTALILLTFYCVYIVFWRQG